jgi:sugar fermentation stimulation protein A
MNGKQVRAYLPNPGRLMELLLPGTTLYLAPGRRHRDAKTGHTVVAVEREGIPIMLHTHLSNNVVRHLIERERIKGLEGARIIRPEFSLGNSRFDLLLERNGEKVLVEVKSCTLFGSRIAMFPDAVTERGRRHLRELAEWSGKGYRACVVFLVQWPRADYFLPDYHTDIEFAKTFYEVRKDVSFIPVSVEWKHDLTLGRKLKLLRIPWDVIKREVRDHGSYIIVLRMPGRRNIRIGSRGTYRFEPGYYLYVGSAMNNLGSRLERHKRKRKKLFWHIDYLRECADVVAALPVRSSERLECELARSLAKISARSFQDFGSSDCSCASHLFMMRDDPLRNPQFIRMLISFRIDRLNAYLTS